MSTTPLITQLTPQGLVVSRLPDRFAQLVALLQGIFGSNINVDPDSIDGQTVGIFAESINNLDQLIEAVYQSFNPDAATGAALSLLVQLNGITRNPGSYSTVALTVTGTTGTTIPAGFLVNSADGSTSWQTLSDATIDNTGTAVVQAQCTEMGASSAAVNTLTSIATPLYGVQSVTNAAIAVVGQAEETDSALRIRRAASTSIGASGPLDSIRGALLNQVGVTQAMVYENNTDAADSNGQPPHSIYAVVQGGAAQDIANVLWFKRSAGVNMVGTQTQNVVDTAGFPHTMKFDRPTAVPIYITVNVKKRTGYPSNGTALIKAALTAFGNAYYTIGQLVVQSEFYAPALAAISNTGSILSIDIGTAPAPSTTTDVTIAYNAIATFDPAYIVVNES